MATGGNFSVSLSKGSDEIFEFCCTPCSKDGDITEAVNECVDCDEFLCSKCTNVHHKLGATSDHKVLGQKDMGKTRGSNQRKPAPPLQKCKAHGGERITAYCANDDVVCCNTGVAVDHKNCPCIEYIVDAATGINYSKDIKKTKANISSTLKEAKGKRSSLHADLEDLDRNKAANVDQVHAFTERQIHRLRQLEKDTIERIDCEHKELSADLGRDVASLDNVISTLDEDLQKLDRSHENQEAQTFVDVKLGQYHEAEGRKLLRQLSNSRKPSLDIKLNEYIELNLKELISTGSLDGNDRVYNAEHIGDFNVKVKQDTQRCEIMGSCKLPDDTMIITDCNNRRIKRLDSSYSVTDHCDTPRGPWGITCTASDEVAVTMTNVMKIQFVSVFKDSMTLTRSFSTYAKCRGISYIGGQLYVACGSLLEHSKSDGTGHIAVFSLHGVPVRKIQNDLSGHQFFPHPLHISVNDVLMYITDWHDGVKVFNRNGTLVSTITDPTLIIAYDVCPLDNGNILVCGASSNNVLQFDGNGRKVTELLNEKDGIEEPITLCYDNNNSRLLVTLNKKDCIKVFDLK